MHFWVGQRVRERRSGPVGIVQSLGGAYLVARVEGGGIRTWFLLDVEVA